MMVPAMVASALVFSVLLFFFVYNYVNHFQNQIVYKHGSTVRKRFNSKV